MNRIGLFISSFVVVTLFSFTSLLAQDSDLKKQPVRAFFPFSVDNDTRIDVNNLDMFVTNHGTIAHDIVNQKVGLLYPKGYAIGSCYNAGITVGAKVDGVIHIAVVNNAGEEYGPGTIENGLPSDPEDPRFRVYKITTGDGPGTPDWDNWPVGDGAPVDEFGNPKLFGNQTLWAVFNDADANYHTLEMGSTDPLGIEVQITVFAYHWPSSHANTAIVKYRIINKGSNQLDDTYFQFWSDPDLGDHNNDYIAYDTNVEMGYCYNSNKLDEHYQAMQPAFGCLMLQGPEADGGGRLVLTSSNTLNSGNNEPTNATEYYNIMQGLNADGSQVIDPTTGNPTTFMHSGDPVTGTGWLDDFQADKRMAINVGPFTMAPDDTQEVIYVILVGQGENYLSSIEVLRAMVPEIEDSYNSNFPDPTPPSVDAASVQIHQPPNEFVFGEKIPSATVAQLGSETVSFDVQFHIAKHGVHEYESWRSVSSLAAGQTAQVEFDAWSPSEPDTYQVALIVILSGDADDTNDTLRTEIVVKKPSAPIDLQLLSRAANEAVLGWQPPPEEEEIAGYNIYRSSTSGGPFTQLNGALISELSYTDNTIPDEPVYYVVTLEITSGFESDDSAELSVYPVMNVSDENILLVNGVHWDSYGQEIIDFYNKKMAGTLDYDFWDVFTNNPVGYTPIGEGAAPPWDLLQQYKSVIWIGNNYQGDLDYWQQSIAALKQYMLSGGNLFLATRYASYFFDNVLATSYAHIDYWSVDVTIGESNPLISLVTELVNMAPGNGSTESNRAYMFMESTEPLPAYLTAFTNIFDWDDLGGTIWRGGFRSELAGGGQFVFFSGRPYRFDEAASQANYDSVLVKWFGHPAPEPTEISIQEIQTITEFTNDDSPYLGQTVTTVGIATTGIRSIWIGARWSFILADTNGGDFSFIHIVQHDTTVTGTNMTSVQPGDLIRVTGVVEEYSGGAPLYSSTQLALLTNLPIAIEILESGRPLPTATLLTNSEFSSLETGERHECRRVRIENCTMIDRNLSGNQALMEDATGQLKINPWFNDVRDSLISGEYNYPPNGTTFHITGYIRSTPGVDEFSIGMEHTMDLEIIAMPPDFVSVTRNPAAPTSSQDVVVSAEITDDGSVVSATIHYSTDNGATYHQVPMSPGTPFTGTIPAQGNGTFVQYYLSAEDNEGLVGHSPENYQYSNYFYTVRDDGLTIYDIQYTPFDDGVSGYTGYEVTVSGIVTADVNDFAAMYFIQDGSGPWTGLAVQDGVNTPARGDSVTVTGRIDEGSTVTTMMDVMTFVNHTTTSTPKSILVNTGDLHTGNPNAEQWEDVLVKVANVTVINPYPMLLATMANLLSMTALANIVWMIWEIGTAI